MSVLAIEKATYDEMRAELEANHLGKWVVVHRRELAGIYDDLQEAAHDAVQSFGRGPYLIMQIGEGSFTLPASILYGSVNADG